MSFDIILYNYHYALEKDILPYACLRATLSHDLARNESY